jgi:hypothetical protein
VDALRASHLMQPRFVLVDPNDGSRQAPFESEARLWHAFRSIELGSLLGARSAQRGLARHFATDANV